jgi:hypothetical protein
MTEEQLVADVAKYVLGSDDQQILNPRALLPVANSFRKCRHGPLCVVVGCTFGHKEKMVGMEEIHLLLASKHGMPMLENSEKPVCYVCQFVFAGQMPDDMPVKFLTAAQSNMYEGRILLHGIGVPSGLAKCVGSASTSDAHDILYNQKGTNEATKEREVDVEVTTHLLRTHFKYTNATLRLPDPILVPTPDQLPSLGVCLWTGVGPRVFTVNSPREYDESITHWPPSLDASRMQQVRATISAAIALARRVAAEALGRGPELASRLVIVVVPSPGASAGRECVASTRNRDIHGAESRSVPEIKNHRKPQTVATPIPSLDDDIVAVVPNHRLRDSDVVGVAHDLLFALASEPNIEAIIKYEELLAALVTAAVVTSTVTRAVAPALDNGGKWAAQPVESKRAAGDDWIGGPPSTMRVTRTFNAAGVFLCEMACSSVIGRLLGSAEDLTAYWDAKCADAITAAAGSPHMSMKRTRRHADSSANQHESSNAPDLQGIANRMQGERDQAVDLKKCIVTALAAFRCAAAANYGDTVCIFEPCCDDKKTFKGFCEGGRIVINLTGCIKSAVAAQRPLVDVIAITMCHEAAHRLDGELMAATGSHHGHDSSHGHRFRSLQFTIADHYLHEPAHEPSPLVLQTRLQQVSEIAMEWKPKSTAFLGGLLSSVSQWRAMEIAVPNATLSGSEEADSARMWCVYTKRLLESDGKWPGVLTHWGRSFSSVMSRVIGEVCLACCRHSCGSSLTPFSVCLDNLI